MIVAELIVKLQALEPRLRVFVRGYEGGFDDANVSEPLDVSLNVNSAEWMGPHDKADPEYWGDSEIVRGIIVR
jgi:hypothetical protein